MEVFPELTEILIVPVEYSPVRQTYSPATDRRAPTLLPVAFSDESFVRWIEPSSLFLAIPDVAVVYITLTLGAFYMMI